MQLGAPGVYQLPPVSARPAAGTPMDVCGFVGVAPRGPARVPLIDEEWPASRPCVELERPHRHAAAVPIESWSMYRNVFGGFEGPGLLPYAVAAFFAQGGRRAYVVRVVHDYGDADARSDQGVARGILRVRTPGRSAQLGLGLLARNEGAWGNRLVAELRFHAQPLQAQLRGTPDGPLLAVPEGSLSSWSLVRLSGSSFRALAFITRTQRQHDSRRGWIAVAQLQCIGGTLPQDGAEEAACEIITASLEVRDSGQDPELEDARNDGRFLLRPGRLAAPVVRAPAERHDELGLHPQHPRWLAQVLCYGSNLVFPDPAWAFAPLLPEDIDLLPMDTASPADHFRGGADRYGDITPDDLVPDTDYVDSQQRGVHALLGLSDLSMVVVPDLYCAHPLLPPRPPIAERPPMHFVEYLPYRLPAKETEVDLELAGLRLDPGQADDLVRIVALQTRLVALADSQAHFMALLDVPPGLTPAQVLRWRTHFTSSYAAAYHPWLLCDRDDDGRDGLLQLCPSAVAAGIVAQVERSQGLPTGPANVLAAGIVDVTVSLGPSWRDELHRNNINTFVRTPGGILLSAARTLSLDDRLRQLSVRRIMLMLRRSLELRMQWVAFENNTSELRDTLELSLNSFLGALHRANFFVGRGDEESFFVRFTESPTDGNRLTVEIGVAPAEPMEYLMLFLRREDDGGLLIAEREEQT